jgi:hypothetical protein
MPGEQPEVPGTGRSGRRRVLVLAGGDAVQLPLPRPLAHARPGGGRRRRLRHGGTARGPGRPAGRGPGLGAPRRSRGRPGAAGTRIEQHPVDKDRTDLALALDAVVAVGPAEVTAGRRARRPTGPPARQRRPARGAGLRLARAHGAARRGGGHGDPRRGDARRAPRRARQPPGDARSGTWRHHHGSQVPPRARHAARGLLAGCQQRVHRRTRRGHRRRRCPGRGPAPVHHRTPTPPTTEEYP